MDEFLALGDRERRNDTNSDQATEFLSAKPKTKLEMALWYLLLPQNLAELVLQENTGTSRTLAI